MGVLIGATVLGWLIDRPRVHPGGGLGGGNRPDRRPRLHVPAAHSWRDGPDGDVFAGFNVAFLHLALAGLVKWLLTSLGLVLCILPGIYLAVGYVFALPLVIDKKMEFWPAMEVSRQVVHRHWWSMFALMIVLAIVACVGFLACGVGALISVPVASAASCMCTKTCSAR